MQNFAKLVTYSVASSSSNRGIRVSAKGNKGYGFHKLVVGNNFSI